MTASCPTDDNTILVRTDAGQRAAFDEIGLDAPRRRLLLLVNGFTRLGDLTTRLDPANDWQAAANRLIESELVSIAG